MFINTSIISMSKPAATTLLFSRYVVRKSTQWMQWMHPGEQRLHQSSAQQPLWAQHKVDTQGWLRREKVLHLIHPALSARVVMLGVALADFFELFEQFPLPVGQIDRGFDHHMTKQVAVAD